MATSPFELQPKEIPKQTSEILPEETKLSPLMLKLMGKVRQIPAEKRAEATEKIDALVQREEQKCPRKPNKPLTESISLEKLARKMAQGPMGLLMFASTAASAGAGVMNAFEQPDPVAHQSTTTEAAPEPRAEHTPASLSEQGGFVQLWEKESQPLIAGLEKVVPGLTPAVVRELLDTYPCDPSEISAVLLSTDKPRNREDYGIPGSDVAGTAAGGFDEEATYIRIFESTNQDKSTWWFTDDLIPHEVAHANDYRTNKKLTPEQRAIEKKWLEERVTQTNRQPFSYVESINSKTFQETIENRAVEYFASIQARFNNKEDLPPEDVAFLKNHLKITAPDFDVDKAFTKRLDIKKRLAEERVKAEQNLRAEIEQRLRALPAIEGLPVLSGQALLDRCSPQKIDASPLTEEQLQSQRENLFQELQTLAATPEHKAAITALIDLIHTRTQTARILQYPETSVSSGLKFLEESDARLIELENLQKTGITTEQEGFTEFWHRVTTVISENQEAVMPQNNRMLSPAQYFAFGDAEWILEGLSLELDDGINGENLEDYKDTLEEMYQKAPTPILEAKLKQINDVLKERAEE